MIAELGIDDEGNAVLWLHGASMAEGALLERFKAFLPVRDRADGYAGYVIIGDRLPGMGNLTAQDATAPSVSTEESIARKSDAR